MKRRVLAILFAIGLAFGATGFAIADDMAGSGDEVKGELVNVDGSFYVIKDLKGVENRVHFDDTTTQEGEIVVGAIVEAYVDNGHVTKIKLGQ